MADRIQREIEEILAKLDDNVPAESSADRKPISITTARERRQTPPKVKPVRQSPGFRLEPATLLFAGAGTMVLGLILATIVADPFIWLSFAGVVIFIGAFIWSFVRTPRPSASGESVPGKVFWRDRYIEYTPSNPHFGARVRRMFRRK